MKNETRTNLCALTFDDSPSSHTERLMEILRERGIHAVFVVSKQVHPPPQRAHCTPSAGKGMKSATTPCSHKSAATFPLSAFLQNRVFRNRYGNSACIRATSAAVPGNFGANTVAIAKAEGRTSCCGHRLNGRLVPSERASRMKTTHQWPEVAAFFLFPRYA